MHTIVVINWDKPDEKAWLNPENIETALSAYCKNTEFKVLEYNELTGSEVLFAFCGWLTSDNHVTTMSAKHNASIAIKKIEQFMNSNRLTHPRDDWEKRFKSPGRFNNLMDPIKEKLLAVRSHILKDERLTYPAAMIKINAPLALIQVELKSKVALIEDILGMPRTQFPIKKG